MLNRKSIEEIRKDFQEELEILRAITGDKHIYKKWCKRKSNEKVLEPIALKNSDKQ